MGSNISRFCMGHIRTSTGLRVTFDYSTLEAYVSQTKMERADGRIICQPNINLIIYLNEECGTLLDDEVLVYILCAFDLALCSETATGLQTHLDGLFKFCSNGT